MRSQPFSRRWSLRAPLAVLACAAVLTGCASGPRTVSADVRTSAAQPPGAAVLHAPRYRFEPAPAAAGQLTPAQVQALAQAALARVGAVRDDANPRVSVQASATVNAYWVNEWGPYGGLSNPRLALGLGVGRGWRGGGIGLGWGWGVPLGSPDTLVYASEVSLLMRDVQTGQIVYDTRARHDGTAHDTDNVLAALFTAALEGYPAPAQAQRRVGVPLLPPAPAASAPAPAASPTPAPPAVGHVPTTQATPAR
ncbi:MAG: DUF4136 domain-containing protein [Pseudomonadota bacterium]|nr:DUF4136 domain-containing protein [Pseudomonadota bacterium]